MAENAYPLISLIIPVYNVEKYFARCMESVLAQTYPNFEVILVDDGSTDNSGRMCDAYAAKDNRVMAFHQKNTGVCRARNLGLESAKGEFVSFIDADDQIDEKYLEVLINAQAEKDYDFTLCEFTNIDENTGKAVRCVSFDCDCAYFVGDIKRSVTPKTLINPGRQMIGNPYCKLFRTRILTENAIRYCESIRLHEDRMFNYEYCRHIESFVYLAQSLYTRRVRPDSAMNIYREDTLVEYQNICKEFLRILKKYNEFTYSECVYCVVITVSEVLPRYVCNPLNQKLHRDRWHEYYAFLNSDSANEVWNLIRESKELPFKHRLLIFLVKAHMTFPIEWMYSVRRARKARRYGNLAKNMLYIDLKNRGGVEQPTRIWLFYAPAYTAGGVCA